MSVVTNKWLGVLGLFLGLLLVGAGTAQAVFVLDFEGLGDLEAVDDFYNGGTGGNGSGPGPDYGVEFSANSLALIDADAGGSGNFANEPSPSTILFWLDQNSAVMNVAAGFDTGFSFYYSSIDYDGIVNVYDGLNATGTLLASIDLPGLGSAGQGDPTGAYDIWMPVGVAFGGTAMSIDFGGTANYIGYDNVTFGSETPVPPIPEPSTLLLLGLGLAGTGAGLARRRRA